MWTRKEVKARGKQAFSLNYWKTVLIALIAVTILGGASGAAGGASGASASGIAGTTYNYSMQSGNVVKEMDPDVVQNTYENSQEAMNELPPEIQQFMQSDSNVPPKELVFIAAIVIGIIFVVVSLLAILISAFLINPLEVGTKRFFIQNLHEAAAVKEVAFGYDHCYKNIVKTMFFKGLYTLLWSLLFIIPGIIKSYEYRMIPYILAEHPDMPTKEVFATSRAMMRGQKWRAFVLDISFILWDILSLFTMGILSIFYVSPYKHMTKAAHYEALAYGGKQEESVVWTES